MAEAHERSEWNRAAVLIAKVHNVNQVRRSDLIGFEDVHPHFLRKREDKSEPTVADLAMLKSALKGR